MPSGIYKRIKHWKHAEESKKKMKLSHLGKSQGSGWKLSKEVIEKMSKSRLGHKYNLGKKHSLETRKKMSESHKKEKAYNWKGGQGKNYQIRNSLEYKLWRTTVFIRDNYTCIWCEKRGVELQADHIKPFCDYPELRFAIDNGRTLCKECHKKTDTYGCKLRDKNGRFFKMKL